MPTPEIDLPNDLFFIDTNIFVYALLASEPLKKQRAVQLLEQALATHSGCISYQVIQEFANVATRKFATVCRPAPSWCTPPWLCRPAPVTVFMTA